MPRNMSFMLTTDQVKNKTKTVTRRLGWWFLKKGDIINACEKCMGLKKGEKVNKICQIRIVHICRVRLNEIKRYYSELLEDGSPKYSDPAKEGFPEMSPDEFVKMFCDHNKCKPETEVNRIRFEYI